MFKINNKDTRTNFTPCSIVSIVNFEQINTGWHSDGKFVLRPFSSYNKLLDRVAFRILSNIHDEAFLRK